MNDNYAELRAEFQKIDRTNHKKLRKWFEDHAYLNIQDLTQIIGKCSREVRILRRSIGIVGQSPKVKKRANTKTVDIAELPANWRTKEWLLENLPKYGTMAIIRASGISRATFYRILRKFEIELPGRVHKNPCCTKAWCHRHYTELKYSIRKCARLAGITHPTFVDWLIKFKIPMRIHKDPVDVPHEVRMLISKLKKQPIVKRIIVYPAHLYIEYHDKVISRYQYKLIPGDQWVLNTIPKITNEYETDISTGIEYPAHIKLSNFENSSIFERDAALHEFVRQISKRGWLPLTVPLKVLQDELETLRNVKESKVIKAGTFTPIHSNEVGRHIMMHFFEHSYIWDFFRRPQTMWKYIKRLITNSKIKTISVYNLIRSMSRSRKSKFRFPNPIVYATIFRRMGITGKILDLKLGSGARAVACGLINCEYRIHDIPRFRQAIDNGFAEFMNLKYAYYDDTEVVDLVIGDGDLDEINIDYALSFSNRARQIMAYVPKEKKLEYQEKYQPTSIIKIKVNPIDHEPNYFFVW